MDEQSEHLNESARERNLWWGQNLRGSEDPQIEAVRGVASTWGGEDVVRVGCEEKSPTIAPSHVPVTRLGSPDAHKDMRQPRVNHETNFTRRNIQKTYNYREETCAIP